MPRRTSDVARRAALLQGFTRLRLILRHPDFQADMAKVIERWHKDPFFESYFELCKKWNIKISSRMFTESVNRKLSVYECEVLLIEDWKSRQEAPDPDDRYLWKPAVSAWDPHKKFCDDYVDLYYDGDESFEIPVPENIPPRGTVLKLVVDLSYPQDILEALIKKELETAMQRRQREIDKGSLTIGQKRNHPNKVDKQLEVYDLVKSGKDFKETAIALGLRGKTVKGPVNTVRSAFFVIRRKILGVNNDKSPIAFEPEAHCLDCKVCQIATTPERLCEEAKRYLQL